MVGESSGLNSSTTDKINKAYNYY